jgi:hypothetical protein
MRIMLILPVRMSLLFSLLVSLLLISCGEDPNVIGGDLVNEDVFDPNRSDTITVITYSVLQDSLITSNLSDANGNYIGSLYDHTFGKTSASLSTAFWLSSTSPTFAEGSVADSVVLSIAYNAIYGDKYYTHTFRIYELDEVLNEDSILYSTYRTKHLDEEMASVTFTPSLDTVYVDNEKVNPYFKTYLDKSFGDRILSIASTSLSSQDGFVAEFNGLYITPDVVNTPGSGSMLKLLLNDAQTYIRIYYHNNITDTTLIYSLVIDSDTPHLLDYEHFNYEDASYDFKNQVLNGDTALGSDRLFLQTFAGVKVKIQFPYFDEFKKLDNLTFNNARLYFYPDLDNYLYGLPSNYDLVRVNSEGKTVSIEDYSEGTSYYNGTYSSTTECVYFNIARHLQNAAKGYYSPDLYLIIRYGNYSPGRCAIYGANPNDETKRVKLDVTYTSID